MRSSSFASVRRPDRRYFFLPPLIVAAILGCIAAQAEEAPRAKLESVQKALQQSKQRQDSLAQHAAALAGQLAQLRAQAVGAAQSAQAHEAAMTHLEAELAALKLEAQAKNRELARRRREESALLAALLHLARNPPIGLALADGQPIDLLRGGLLMGAAVPPLIERASLLGIELKTLADLKNQIQDAEARHRIEADALTKEQARIAALMAQKSVLQQRASQGAADSAQEVQRLAAQATDLEDLIRRADAAARERQAEARRRQAAAARLAPSPPPPGSSQTAPEQTAAVSPALIDPLRPPTIRPFSQAKGRMLPPAAGNIVLVYGATDPAGETARGLTFETRPGAEVVAPFDGRVVFAGAFRGYGEILIISHGDGYHSLVAGLDRIDASVGQWLVAGEPIGSMSASEAKPRLYLELRQNGQPINPLPWLATHDAKVRG